MPASPTKRAKRRQAAAIDPARDHPRVVPGLTNLATLYCHLGRWSKAEEPIRHARDIVVRMVMSSFT
jgi:hypothetical protein